MNILEEPFSFIDVETTGTSPTRDRVIEIAIIRTEAGNITQTYETFVNPHLPIPPEITAITGINENDIAKAPDFIEIQDSVREILAGSIFVAHNARFDYAFVKNEFKRYGNSFTAKVLCSVKLARSLYPTLPRHNLDTIISHFNIECLNRHRALGDAEAVKTFFDISIAQSEKKFNESVKKLLKTPSLPKNVDKKIIDSLPETPGVYEFVNSGGLSLYIGKSKSIKSRVKAHFTNDHASATELKISSEVKYINTYQTAGELGALIKESAMIKEVQPLHNRKLRRVDELIAVKKAVNKVGYYTLEIESSNIINIENVEGMLGLFKSKKQKDNVLRELADEFKLCHKLCGLENGSGACFYTQLEKCRGACIGEEEVISYNSRFIEAFANTQILKWPFTTPICLKEESENLVEQHFVYKWFYLGSLVYDKVNDTEKLTANEYKFDYDFYKTVLNFIRKPTSQVNVKSISVLPEELDLFSNQL